MKVDVVRILQRAMVIFGKSICDRLFKCMRKMTPTLNSWMLFYLAILCTVLTCAMGKPVATSVDGIEDESAQFFQILNHTIQSHPKISGKLVIKVVGCVATVAIVVLAFFKKCCGCGRVRRWFKKDTRFPNGIDEPLKNSVPSMETDA